MAATGVGLTAEQVTHMIQISIQQVMTQLNQQGMMPHQEKPKNVIEIFSKRADSFQSKGSFQDWKKKMKNVRSAKNKKSYVYSKKKLIRND